MRKLMRLKQTEHLRDLCSETDFTIRNLIQPIFGTDGQQGPVAVASLPGVFRQNESDLLRQISDDLSSGVKNFLLFPIPSQKQSHNFSFESGQKLIQKIKEEFSNDLSLWVDTCLCSTTANGHCCLFHKDGKINLTSTVQTLSEEALAFAQAGADGISPSDMMDGRVLAIRNRLDDAGFPLVPIMSYSTKFASHFYGPFREIADSSPQHGDRRQYQLDVRNRSEAIEASLRCSKEGADLLMVKPGLTAIDLISDIATQTGLPVGAYQVSGEYASLALLAKNGLGDFKQLFAETLHVFRRAGARYIITYGARHARSVGF